MYAKLLSLFLLSFMLLTASAQFRNIPAEVTEAFKTKFPTATKVTWRDKITSFQAAFVQGDRKAQAYFTSKGEWIKTEKRYDFTKLPVAVKDGFSKSKYAGTKVLEVMEIDDNEKGLQYLVVIKRGDITKRNLYFTQTGQLVKDDMNL